MSKCILVKSPITNREMQSKLFPQLQKEFGEDADKMYDYIYSASFLSRFGDWTKQTKDSRLEETYLTGEPKFEEVIKYYNSDDSLAIQTNKRVRDYVRDTIVLSKSNLKDYQIEDAKESIFYYASEEFFKQYEENHSEINAQKIFDYAQSKLKELADTTTNQTQKDDINELLSDFDNIKLLVAQKFKQVGVNVNLSKELQKQLREVETDVYTEEDEIDNSDENEVNNVSEVGQRGVENAWATSSFSVNPTDTASTRLKMRLSKIVSIDKTGKPENTYLGTPKFVDLDTTYLNLLRVSADQPDLDEQSFIKLLEDNKKAYPWMQQLIEDFKPKNKRVQNTSKEDLIKILVDKGESPESAKIKVEHVLKNEARKYSQSEKNELLTNIKMPKSEFFLTLWNRNKQGIIEANILNANSQSIDQIIINSWYENFKNSSNVEIRNGQLFVSKETADRIYNDYKKLTEIKDESIKLQELSKLLSEIGVNISTDGLSKIVNGSYRNKKNQLVNKYLSNSRSFSANKDNIISLKDDSYFNAIFSSFKFKTQTEEETEDGEKFDIFNYNPYEGGTTAAVNYLKETLVKVYKEEAEILYSDSHKDINGNNVYAYSKPKSLDNTVNRIKLDNSSEAAVILSGKFAKNSGTTSLFTDNLQKGKITVGYDEGMKKREDDTGVDQVKMSEKEIALHRLSKVLNGKGSFRHVLGVTISDKGRFANLRIPEIELSYDGNVSSKSMTLLYDLAQAETDRINDFYLMKVQNQSTGNPDYDKSAMLYHFFPLLNKEILISSGLAEQFGLKDGDYLDGSGAIHNTELMQKIVDYTLSNSIDNRIKNWKDIGLIDEVTVNEKGSPKIKNLNIDAKWQKKHNFYPISKSDGVNIVNKDVLDKLYKQAALEYEFYNMYVSGEYYRNIGGDPANALKGKKTVADTIEATKVEIIKRNAKDIAPGVEPNWVILNDSGEYEKSTHYNFAIIGDNNHRDTLTQNDYINNHPLLSELYKGIERTDAQEYAVGSEFLDGLFAKGEINDEQYKKVRTKLISQEKNGVTAENLLTPEELKKLILQPQKSVYVGDYKMTNGYNSKVYIKSSTIPLIPQLTKNLDIDKILQKMLKSGTHRAAFKTAVKLGRFNVTDIFDKTTGLIQDNVELRPIKLSRAGFRIQQEVPYDANKAKVVFVSQMDKLIVGDILNLDSFELNGKKYTGEELRTEKENIRKEIFKIAKDELFRKLDVEIQQDEFGNPILNFKSMTKFKNYIREEANSSTKLNINDEASIYLNENGEFDIPLFFNNSANKFESLLTSIVSKVVLNKISGKSYVQTTANAWIASSPEVLKNSGIVFSNSKNFDITKGLQTIRIVDRATKLAVPGITSDTFIKASPEQRNELLKQYEVLPAQVVVPFKFRDNNGNLLKLEDFTKEDGTIDHSKLPHEVLRLIGSRIPFQGHSSALPIEIVGFLPIKADTIIVPVEITKQMGSDMDVDKVFTYQYNTYYKDGKLSLFNLPKNARSSDIEKALQNKYIDLHWSILTNPQMTDKILAPLDINDFGDAVELIGSSDKSLYPESVISASFNEKQFLENRSAKTGVAAESLMATFNALSQGTDLNLVQEIKNGDETTTEPFYFTVSTIDKNGNVVVKKLGKLSSSTGLKGLGNTIHRVYRQKEDGSYEVIDTITRTKSDSIMNLQSEAVDNAKSGNLGKGNINDYTMAAINSLARLESEDSENNILPMNSLIWFVKQQSIVDYVRLVQTLNDTTVEDFNPNKKREMIVSLMDKYMDMAGVYGEKKYDKLNKDEMDYDDEYKNSALLTYLNYDNNNDSGLRDYSFNREYAIPVELSNDKSKPGLFELLKKDGIDEKVWAYHQLNILKIFIALDELGALERDSISALNSDSKGVGKSLIASNIKEQNYIDVSNGNKKSNASIDGNPTMKIEGFENIANSDRQIGQATENSVVLANQLYSRFYPYKAPLMQRIFSLYSMFTGKNKETQIGESEQRSLINSFKSFAFTSPLLRLFDENIQNERKRLLTTEYDDKYKFIEIGDLKALNSPTKSRVTTYEDLPNGIYRTKNNTFLKITKMGKLDFNKSGSLNLKMVDINGKEFNLNTTEQLDVLARREGYESFTDYKTATFGVNNKFFSGNESKYLYSFELVSGVDIKSQSLAKRLNTMKVKYPNNYLIKRLSSELSRDVTREFDLVKYSSAVTQKLDDIENTRAFAELLTSEDSDTREFANDLIKYAYITGGIQNAISYVKYIPSQVLMTNEFSKGLRDIQTALEVADTSTVNHISFLRQYFQHNPYKALKLNEEELFGKEARIPETFIIPKNNPTKYEASISGIRNKLIGEDSKNEELRMEQTQAGLFSSDTAPKFVYLYDVVNKRPILFEAQERADGFHYTKLPLLGTKKIGSTEYDASTNEVVSSALNSGNTLSTQRNETELVIGQPAVEQPMTQEIPVGNKTYSGTITSLQPNQVFVFGSNTQGRHGLGAAKTAMSFGAKYGQAEGFQGQSFAIITKDLTVPKDQQAKSRSPEQIKEQIGKLYKYANENPSKEFLVAYKGDGNNLNGYSSQDMATMFGSLPVPNNIVFEQNFDKLVREKPVQAAQTKPSSFTQQLTTTQSNKLLQDILQDIAKQDSSHGELAKVLLAHPNIKKATIGLFTQEELKTKGNVAATAYVNTNEIKFNASKLGTSDFNTAVLHEVLHIATSLDYNTYALDPNLFKQNSAEKAKIFEQLDKHREAVKSYLNAGNTITLKNGSVVNKAGLDEFNKKSASGGYANYDNLDVGFYYGLTNTKEFISVLMTDATMQEVLSQIPYSNKTLWDRIKDLFSRFVSQLNKELGTKVDNSILSEAVGSVLDLVTLQNKVVEKQEVKKADNLITKKQRIIFAAPTAGKTTLLNSGADIIDFDTWIGDKTKQIYKTNKIGDETFQDYKARFPNELKKHYDESWKKAKETGKPILVSQSYILKQYKKDFDSVYLVDKQEFKNRLLQRGSYREKDFEDWYANILDSAKNTNYKTLREGQYIGNIETFNQEDNLIAPEDLSAIEKQLLKSKKFNLLKTSTGQQVITLPMKPQKAYLEARQEIIKLNKEHGEGSATISNRIVLDKGKEVQVEAVKINLTQNTFEVSSVNDFLEKLSPSERLIFRKLKLNNTIETRC